VTTDWGWKKIASSMRPRRCTETCGHISITFRNSSNRLITIWIARYATQLCRTSMNCLAVCRVSVRCYASRCFRTCRSWAGLIARRSPRWRERRRSIATVVRFTGGARSRAAVNACAGPVLSYDCFRAVQSRAATLLSASACRR
jgi:hypothetical protein